MTVLMAGAPGDLMAQLAKRLASKGVTHDRMLFCDYF